MGIGSNVMVEKAEEEYREAKEKWIKKQLGNPDATVFTDGWAELSEEFDQPSEEDDYDPDESCDS